VGTNGVSGTGVGIHGLTGFVDGVVGADCFPDPAVVDAVVGAETHPPSECGGWCDASGVSGAAQAHPPSESGGWYVNAASGVSGAADAYPPSELSGWPPLKMGDCGGVNPGVIGTLDFVKRIRF